ncbi:MT-A70 family methyltransferase [Pseudoalteromonas sp. Angola-30]|uniref:MT-A70 family methyltransferase n=1 Tax=Pseudoalteromonas sp. Angola-30 TaxID=3025341 RepID=UPI0023593D8A|nr:MT-A70 family methyltransferase [Pseudoalteromonas sp. Angola-30]MDC9527568.1 MT-A70 family methyltransferase [Pseudoalteromonas sp. Angola-30]
MFEQFNGQKFNLIYADPAWQFSNKKTGGSMKSGAAHHYKSTMSVDELKAMRIDDIAADDCILVMWYVGSMPQEALDVVKAWGFTLKNMNGFVWNKLTINNNPLFGMGFWTRAGSESAIIAVKGKPKVASRSVRAVGNYDTESLDEILGRGVFSGAYPIGQHSEKPNEFREACVELAGDVPRIELFSRKRVKGWSVWGNEVGKLNKKAKAA